MENLNYLSALADWYETSQGRQLYQYEANQLAQFLPNCFGYQLLQIGGPTHLEWLSSSPIQHQLLLMPDLHVKTNSGSFCAHPGFLPFAPDSLDLILLPHLLECIANPELVIKEACNALVPGGFIIAIGLNRVSLWGLQQSYRMMLTKNPYFPWFQHFMPLSHLQRHLFENNCAIDTVHVGCYQPLPHGTAPLINEHSFWDALGTLAWPAFGSIYVILARKQVHGMTPIWDKNLRSALYEIKVGLAQQQRSINDDQTN
ncbi:MAG: methyltransferase domain-containing protein [Gammaproteobacteria bacterium]